MLSNVVCLSCIQKQQFKPEETSGKEVAIIGGNDTVAKINISSMQTLKEHGLQLTQQMKQLANDHEFLNFCSHSKEVNKIVAYIAQHQYEVPKKVFSLSRIHSHSNSSINDRLIKSIPSQLNALSGTASLAATSLLVAEDAFFYGLNLKEPVIYLYLYDRDWQNMVIFRPAQDGIVQANSYFVRHDMLNNIKNIDDMKSFFSEILKMDRVEIQECK